MPGAGKGRAQVGPFAVGGDQDDGDLGDRRLRLDEGLHTFVLGDPLLQVPQIRCGCGAPRAAPASKLVEQSHLGLLLPGTWHPLAPRTNFDSARAASTRVHDES